ncbi:hypothetical protein LX92_02796 [Maribacter polysiphoniae]|nr:hypothetical protein LX92_02796 [Maribacter polysiphoniae]
MEFQYTRLTCEVWTLKEIAILGTDPDTNETIKIMQCFKCKTYWKVFEEYDSHHGTARVCVKENEEIEIFNRNYSFDSSEIIDIRKTTSLNNKNNQIIEPPLPNKVYSKQSDNKFKILLLTALITSPIWVLLFFHFIPDKISENNLYEDGIKTVAKIEFYTIEKEAGSGKLGGQNKHDVKIANYVYRDNHNNEFKGKVKSGLVPISLDSTIQVLFLENNPSKHLVIKRDGNGVLGKPRE